MIGDSIAYALPELRAYAESLMLDRGRLTRPSATKPVLNETTGAYDTPPPAKLYEGEGRVTARDANGSTVDIGDQSVGVVGFLVNLPCTVADAQPGDVWTVLDSLDPRLVGRSLTVTAVRASSTPVQRQLVAIDNQG